MSKDNGGSAYPVPGFEYLNDADQTSPERVVHIPHHGMTLRDYFAAAAAQGIMASGNACPETAQHFANIAEDAYILADAMLAERTK